MEFSRSFTVSALTAVLEWIFFLWYIQCRTRISLIELLRRDVRKRVYVCLMTAAHFGLQFTHQPIALHCVLLILLWTITICVIYDYPWHSAVFESSILCLILELGKSLYRGATVAWVINAVLTHLPVPVSLSGSSLAVAAYLWYLLYLALAAVIVRRRPGSSLRYLQVTVLQTASLLLPLLLYLSVRQLQTNLILENTQIGSTLWFSFDLLQLAAAVCALLDITVTTGMISAQVERSEFLHLSMLSEKQHQQYLIQKESMEAVNRKYHDLKHYLTAMEAELDHAARISGGETSPFPTDGSASQASPEETYLRQFIRQLRREISPYETIQATGNRVMDVLLAERIQECQEKHIRFIPLISGKELSVFHTIDLCTLFGNAMDNAIEASLLLPEDEREISVKIGVSDSILILRFQNFSRPVAEGKDSTFHTTKEDTSSHGYGLESIRTIAEKYNAAMTAHYENGQFELTILVPLPGM